MSLSEILLNERLDEESLEDMEPEATSSTYVAATSTSAASSLPASNVPKHQAVTPKSRKKQLSATEQVLEFCQKSIEKIGNDLQERNDKRIELQKEILAENKAFREIQQQAMQKISEQLIVANQLREERNQILKEMVLQMRNGNNPQ